MFLYLSAYEHDAVAAFHSSRKRVLGKTDYIQLSLLLGSVADDETR
jgi:hypothetical protein